MFPTEQPNFETIAIEAAHEDGEQMIAPPRKRARALRRGRCVYLAWALQDTRIDRMPLHGNADPGAMVVRFCGEPVCVECKDTKMPNYRKHWRELKVEMANMDTPTGCSSSTAEGAWA